MRNDRKQAIIAVIGKIAHLVLLIFAHVSLTFVSSHQLIEICLQYQISYFPYYGYYFLYCASVTSNKLNYCSTSCPLDSMSLMILITIVRSYEMGQILRFLISQIQLFGCKGKFSFQRNKSNVYFAVIVIYVENCKKTLIYDFSCFDVYY